MKYDSDDVAQYGKRYRCAEIESAIMRSYPKAIEVHLFQHFTFVLFKTKAVRFATSPTLLDLLVRHEAGEEVKDGAAFSLDPVVTN